MTSWSSERPLSHPVTQLVMPTYVAVLRTLVRVHVLATGADRTAPVGPREVRRLPSTAGARPPPSTASRSDRPGRHRTAQVVHVDLRAHPDLAPIVARQLGVLSVAQLQAYVSRGTIRAQLAARRWQRVGRGVVALHNADLSPQQLALAALLRSPEGSALSGATALTLDGVRGFESNDVHITIPCGSRTPGGITAVVHWSRHLGEVDVHPAREPRRTRLPRSVLDLASWQVDEREVRRVVLSVVSQRFVSVEQLRLHLPRRGPCRHHGLIAESVDDAEGGIASVPEREFQVVLRAGGLPLPETQVIRQRPSRRYYLDVDWARFGYSAEIEGAHHFDLENVDTDLRRYNDLVIAGDRVLRFSSYAVRHEPGLVIATLAAALRSRGWRA